MTIDLGTVQLDADNASSLLTDIKSTLGDIRDKVGEVNEKSGRIFNQERLENAKELFTEISHRLVEMGREMVEAAVDGERTARAIAILGPAYARVAEATNDTVDASEALRAQQTLIQAGFHVSADELAALTSKAREYALATGTTTPEALSRLTNALEMGTARGLRPFGLAAQEGETRAHLLHRVLGELHDQQEATTPATRTLGEEVATLTRNWHELVGAVALSITRMLNLVPILRTATGAIHDLFETLQASQQNDAQANIDNARASATERYMAAAQQARRAEAIYGSPGAAELPTQTVLSRLTPQQIDALTARLRQASAGHGGNTIDETGGAGFEFQLQGIGLAAAQYQRANDAAARAQTPEGGQEVIGGGGGGGASPRAAEGGGHGTVAEMFAQLRSEANEAQRKLDEVTARAQTLRVSLPAIIREDGENQLAYTHRVTSAYETLVQQQEHTNELMRQATAGANAPNPAQLAADWNRDLGVMARDTDNYALQMRNAFSGLASTTQTSAQRMSAAAVSAFQSMTGAFKAHLSALITGKETIGQALEGMLKDTLLSVATESAVKALYEGAAAIASAAGDDYAKAGQHAIAAAEYAAVAVVAGGAAYAMYSAGSGAATTSTGNASGGGSGAASAGPGAHGSSSGSGTINYTINVSGVMGNEQTQDTLRRMMDSMAMRRTGSVSYRSAA